MQRAAGRKKNAACCRKKEECSVLREERKKNAACCGKKEECSMLQEEGRRVQTALKQFPYAWLQADSVIITGDGYDYCHVLSLKKLTGSHYGKREPTPSSWLLIDREMAQQLKALVVLPEDLNSIPSTHMAA
ncbi:hypothetical protein STEG23_020687 [Scotinomys teguina]